jgi:hypothetical protein
MISRSPILELGQRPTHRLLGALFTSLILAACTQHAPPVTPEAATPSRAAAPAPAAIPVHDIPAMTTFSVSLLNPVGTRLSAPGDSFRASVISPLTTLRGYTLVPVGSVLRGRVVAVERAPASRLRLKFDSVTTTAGPVPVFATLTEAQPNPFFVVRQARRADSDYDVTLDGVPAVPLGGPSATAALSHGDIRLTTKTQLQVILVHPLRVSHN